MLSLGNEMEYNTKTIADLGSKMAWSGIKKVSIPDEIPPL